MHNSFVVSLMADYAIIPAVAIGIFAMVFKVPKGQRLNAYSRALVAGLTAYLLAKLAGLIYQPSGRPFEVMGVAAEASYLGNKGFPSDHVLLIAALTFAVWFEAKSRYLAVILTILTLVIGIGRIIALVHTPIDVIGGLVFAGIGALWYINSKPKRKG